MQIEKNRKNRWQIEFNSETLTLTLGERGRRTYWVYASPMAALVRDRPAQPASSGRGTGRSAAHRRDAGAHARGLESEAPSMASSTAARSPTGERARRRASRGGAALPTPPGHHGQRPSPPFRGERRQRGRMSLGFAGDAASPSFVPAKRALGRPILIVGDGRLGTAAGERAKCGPRGR